MFMNDLREEMLEGSNYSTTENGATGYRTTGKSLLDLNFAVASLRRAFPDDIVSRFMKAFFENKVLAMQWLFFARDIRGGLGERRLFRIIITSLANSNPEYIIPLIKLIPEYGRFDDLWCLLDTRLSKRLLTIIKKQLTEDIKNYKDGKSISLLAKWLPSANASSSQTRAYAKKIYKHIGISEREYRKSIVKLRTKLDVVEKKMSAKNWGDIVYEAVPSRANLIYNSAFLRHDEKRRRAFLESLEKGETKINAATLFPHDIVHRYMAGNHGHCREYDATLENLWKALPDMVQGCGNTIVVADGSGSMLSHVGNTNVTALDVANSLAIYFAERSSGQFKDQYITFSEFPQLIDLGRGNNLREKLQIAYGYSEVANTDIEAVFDLILETAVNHNMAQEDLPRNILIISDMEFDGCVVSRSCVRPGNVFERCAYRRPGPRLFDVISKRYKKCGYKLPRLVFWNVNSRTGTIPVKQNDLGVALVSGFSTNIVKMVMSGQTDPYEALLETLNSERYLPVAEALSSVI